MIKEIKKKIKEVEKQLIDTEINMASVEYYDKLLIIFHNLWDLLYFKLNQEKDFLEPPKKEDDDRK